MTPPPGIDALALKTEACSVFWHCGGAFETPGCPLCMGNQARCGRHHGDVHVHLELPTAWGTTPVGVSVPPAGSRVCGN
ncbi:MAG: hypothetical protein R2860_16270 [Desulfobacterales bacterium]